MSVNLIYLIAGGAMFLAAVLPNLLERYAVSAAMVLLVLGMGIGLLPLPEGMRLDPVLIRPQVERVTEFAILVALMGVGLAIDRSFDWRSRASWSSWSPTWRLLALAMPLSIGAIALLGWGLGVAPAAALLLGAALAPTDPVLASDVQVGGPRVGEEDEVSPGEPGDSHRTGGRDEGTDDHDEDEPVDEKDDVRFALTSEAGLNDGLAFPFVTAALLLATAGGIESWGLQWLAWDLVGKVALGVAAGAAVGWVLARVAFRSPSPSLRLAEQGEPLLALAALVMTYGLSQLVGGYGFVSVFVCGMTLRAAERNHHYHRSMHEVVQRLERLLTLIILLVLGMGMTKGVLDELDWRGVAIAVALVFVVRPLAGWLSLSVRARPAELPGGLGRREKLATAFFGVRGVGSLYYLAFAAGEHAFPEERWMWSTVAFTILLSVMVHGTFATPVMRHLERRRERQHEPERLPGSHREPPAWRDHAGGRPGLLPAPRPRAARPAAAARRRPPSAGDDDGAERVLQDGPRHRSQSHPHEAARARGPEHEDVGRRRERDELLGGMARDDLLLDRDTRVVGGDLVHDLPEEDTGGFLGVGREPPR
ncbi:K(+)/H(+) antiporter NhaP2 [Terrabacter sp. BE26]